jgi:glycosyltransferase involved in cell wall biosynthesis
MKPLVSVLIPCFNAEKWLTQTIESVLNQTWTNIEIIIVDDGSSDNSFTIAKSFESDKIKVISQVNNGASAARNRAFQESQGDFIQYLDADDLLAPDKIERQVKLLSNENSEYVACGEWGRFYTSPDRANFIPEAVWRDMPGIDWLVCSWEGGGMMHPAAWLVPRTIAVIAGSWNEDLSLNDDGEYFCRVILASKGVKFCSGAKSYYRSGNSSSLSAAKSVSAMKSAFLSFELATSKLLAKENSKKTRHACASVFQRFIYDVYPSMPEFISKAEEYVNLLGGSDLQLTAGHRFRAISKLLGWKTTKRIQRLLS